MKRIIIALISCILIASLVSISVFSIEVPSTASPLTVPIKPRFIFSNYPYTQWYVSNTTSLVDDWQYGELNDQSPIIAPGIIFTEDQDEATYYLKDTTTYYFQYELTTNNSTPFFGISTNAEIYRAVPNFMITEIFGDISVDTTQVGRDFRNYLDWCPEIKDISRNIDTQVTQFGSAKYRIQFVFSTKSGIEDDKFCGMLLFSNGSIDEDDRLEFISVQAWSDESLSIYEELVSGQLKDINDSINNVNGSIIDGFDGIQESLDDLNDTLIGPEVNVDPSLDNATDELEDLQSEVDRLISNQTHNDESFAVNTGSLDTIKNYIFSNYHPEDYNGDVGSEISKVFNLFMPYVGIVVWINLTLGVALSFIRGHQDA